jgi:hydrogenase-4 component E
MQTYLYFLSILILVSSFVLIANKRVNAYVRTFRLQSLLLALCAGVLGVNNLLHGEGFELLIVCILIVAIKVVFIPKLLKSTIQKVEYRVEKDFFLNIPVSIIICCGIFLLTCFMVSRIEGLDDADTRVYLVNSISVVLIGLFFMISRKKAIGQIVGFLIIENGLFTAAIMATRGIPMIIELGIFLDVLTAVLIMGILVFRINENFESIDINKLKKLRG